LTRKIPQSSVKTDVETDGWGAEDVAKDAVAEFLPVPLDLI
jgi:hypothetical protein